MPACYSGKSAFTPKDKAYYLDPEVINFVRPGLVITITGASIGSDGTIQAQFTVTDPEGLPLDLQGVSTPGPISTTFVAAYTPKGTTDYINFIGRTATGTQG